eukprot:12909629-Prorocentrum_lima.AAC.1
MSWLPMPRPERAKPECPTVRPHRDRVAPPGKMRSAGTKRHGQLVKIMEIISLKHGHYAQKE